MDDMGVSRYDESSRSICWPDALDLGIEALLAQLFFESPPFFDQDRLNPKIPPDFLADFG